MRRYILWIASAVYLVTVAGISTGAEETYEFISTMTAGDQADTHVMARSHSMPHDFVDGQWEGIIAASDDNTYFSFSCHSPNHNGQFYRYDPRVDQVEHIIDLGRWCGETDSVGKLNTQGKIHSTIYEGNGKLYCSTTSSHSTFAHPYQGGHFLCYHLDTGECEDLAHYEGLGGGLL